MNEEIYKQNEEILDLSTEEYGELLSKAPIYAKKGTVSARQVSASEEVRTILADGTVETVNTANPGDFIVTNPGGEQYVMGYDKFGKRYEPTEEEGVYSAKGKIRAIVNPHNRDITIEAPWGGEQKGGSDCMIATPYDPEDPDNIGSSRYLIGYNEFLETYSPEVDSSIDN